MTYKDHLKKKVLKEINKQNKAKEEKRGGW